MRKTFLILLMAIVVSTPALANEVDLENLFSIENTYWSIMGNGPEAGDYYEFSEGYVDRCGIRQLCIEESCVPIAFCFGISEENTYTDYVFFALFSYDETSGFLLPFVGIGMAFNDSGDIYILIKRNDISHSPTENDYSNRLKVLQ